MFENMCSDWSSRESVLLFNTPFNVSYGGGQDRGVLYNYCDRPGGNIIHCRWGERFWYLCFDRFSFLRSDDPYKGWRFEYTLIFSKEGLVNKRSFITKYIGAR